jgi:hypothetical protein
MEQLVPQDHKVQLDLMVQPDLMVQLALPDQKVQLACKDPQA